MTNRTAVVVGGNRIPFAKANGPYASASNLDMLIAALDGLIARFGLSGQQVGEVAAGAVLKHTRDFNLTREAVLGSALDLVTPAVDLHRPCGTGLETVVYIANKIRLGQLENGIAGGVDSASDAPIVVSEGLRHALLAANRARLRSPSCRRWPASAPATWPRCRRVSSSPGPACSMGESRALTTAKWGITRQAQDELALASHQNLAKAWDAGFFDDLVTSYLKVGRDTLLRPDTSLEALGKLKTVFGKGDDATMTAGNSTALTDGAAVVCWPTSSGRATTTGRYWPRWWTPRSLLSTTSPVRTCCWPRPRPSPSCWNAMACNWPTSTATSSTRPSPARCWPPSRPWNSGAGQRRSQQAGM